MEGNPISDLNRSIEFHMELLIGEKEGREYEIKVTPPASKEKELEL